MKQKESVMIKTTPKHRPERDRLVFEVLRAVKGMTPGELSRRASYGKGFGTVSASTIRNWRVPVASGGTRYPQAATLAAVGRAVGLELRFVRSNARGEE